MYRKLVNPFEEEVSKLLNDGWTLHSVTPVRMPYTQTRTDLIYHFIKTHVNVERHVNIDINNHNIDYYDKYVE